MTTARSLVLASLVTIGLSSPVLAETLPHGNVYFAPEVTIAVMFSNFDGIADGVTFRASEADMTCESISIFTRAGGEHVIFDGSIAQENEVRIELPEVAQEIGNIAFACFAEGAPRGKIDVTLETVS